METNQVKEAARVKNATLLDYFSFPHPNQGNVAGKHETEVKCLGALYDY